MIKINKSISAQDIPQSLIPAFKANFPTRINRTAKTTSKRRLELIRHGSYIDTKTYSSRYKLKDIKTKLKGIYNNKCAYCEQRVEQFHVEHYRPKQIYYWLAFSWDNLLSACHFCNTYKSTNFRINGTRASLNINLRSIKNINNLSTQYDTQEVPDLINPEVIDPTGYIQFGKDGSIFSTHQKFNYTISTVRISRRYLNDNRKKVLDDLIRDLKNAFIKSPTPPEQEAAIGSIVLKFVTDAKDPKNDFLAFRNYVITHWLREVIKDIKT